MGVVRGEEGSKYTGQLNCKEKKTYNKLYTDTSGILSQKILYNEGSMSSRIQSKVFVFDVNIFIHIMFS